jgi:DNA repair exonuclease SbcCD ATPase subunit
MALFDRPGAERAAREREKFEEFKKRLSEGSEKERDALEFIKDLEANLEKQRKKYESLQKDLQTLGNLFTKLFKV